MPINVYCLNISLNKIKHFYSKYLEARFNKVPTMRKIMEDECIFILFGGQAFLVSLGYIQSLTCLYSEHLMHISCFIGKDI